MPIGNGGIIGPSNTPTAIVASGVWRLAEAQRHKAAGTWPNFVSIEGVLDGLNLLTNRKLSLDPAVLASWTGSGKWNDLGSGSYDFFRGADNSAGADDPTFNGTPGGNSGAEYWSFDGGDKFRYDASNETWMENIHKDGAKFTIGVWVYLALSGTNGIIGTEASNGANVGFSISVTSGGVPRLRVAKGGSPLALDAQASVVSVPATTWSFIGVSVDEAAGDGFLQVNGDTEDFTSTYTTPSSSGATYTLDIASTGNAVFPMTNGSRMGPLFVIEGEALTKPQMANIYQISRERFGV